MNMELLTSAPHTQPPVLTNFPKLDKQLFDVDTHLQQTKFIVTTHT
jgi:hypothetical protein